MSAFDKILGNLPEIKGPTQKRLPFKEKLKWTLIVLVAFFILSVLPLVGLGPNNLQNFEFLSIILGASFGSVMSLGIGPIVTASIVLQLLNGAGILKLDTHSHEGRVRFEGIQKLLAFFFIIFEAIIYVVMGGLAPPPGAVNYGMLQIALIAQLCLGGLIVMFMDEIVNKWGFGSGVSLFIAAGVSSQIFLRAFSPFTTQGLLSFIVGQPPVGKVWVFILSLIKLHPEQAFIALSTILATLIVFVFSVYAQAMKVEIPLSFGRIRGHGVRWPLRFMYTSNIPVILTAALMANVQLWANLMQRSVAETAGILSFVSRHVIGQFSGGNVPVSGLVYWLNSPNILEAILTKNISSGVFFQGLAYTLFMVLGAVVFSIFWVQTSGMDAGSQAGNIMSSGLQIPGFRRDQRVIEHILNRYIFPLTIMGAITVGVLAALADLSGALSRGTGILLTVMIIYKLYEDIARDHMMDMYPALRKMMGK